MIQRREGDCENYFEVSLDPSQTRRGYGKARLTFNTPRYTTNL